MITAYNIGFQFKLSGISGNVLTFRTRQNVKKRFANLVYLKDPPADSVRISYVGSSEITPDNVLHIGDRSDESYFNSRNTTIQEIQFTGVLNNLFGSNFITTQQYTEADSGNIPLYYVHILSKDIIVESVRIFDKDFVEVSKNTYKLVGGYSYNESTGIQEDLLEYCIYNSLESKFSNTTGEYQVYYIQYTLNNIVYTVLLNNELAYKAAQSEDIWSVTLGLKPWCNAYLLDGSTLHLPSELKKSFVKYIETNRIHVTKPASEIDTDPWFVRVYNGSFSSDVGSTETGNIHLDYSIPEFENQNFNPIQPYKLAAHVQGTKIADRLIKLTNEDVVFGPMYSHIYIVAYLNGAPQFAITDDDDYDGLNYSEFGESLFYNSNNEVVKWSVDSFNSIDRLSGIVYTNVDVLDSYDIYTTYSYSEKCYTLSSLMMNPIYDSTVNSETRVIYLVPESSTNQNLGVQLSTIKYLKVSFDGIITDTNQDGDDNNVNIKFATKIVNSAECEGYTTTGVIGLHYSWRATTQVSATLPAIVEEVIAGSTINVVSTSTFPSSGWLRAIDENDKYRYFKYTAKTDTSFLVSDSSDECPTTTTDIPDGNTIELVNFVDDRTLASTRNTNTEITYFGYDPHPTAGYLKYPNVFCRYFVLAELSVNPPHKITDLVNIDVRKDGGGIDPEKYEEAKNINPEVQWINDNNSFEGQVYPGNSVIVVKLPVTLKDKFTLENIRQIVYEAVPFGVYPLIRFYGYQPRIISILPVYTQIGLSPKNGGAIEIKWEKEGEEFVYDIWYSVNKNGPWTKANRIKLVDNDGDYNTFTVGYSANSYERNLQFVTTNMNQAIPHYFKITMEDKYYQWWYGYDGCDSIEGGLGLTEDPPIGPFGNTVGIQFEFTY